MRHIWTLIRKRGVRDERARGYFYFLDTMSIYLEIKRMKEIKSFLYYWFLSLILFRYTIFFYDDSVLNKISDIIV